MHRFNSVKVVLGFAILAAASQALGAGDPANGKALFTTNCSSCHKLGALDVARTGADDPAEIQRAISVVPPMSFLKGSLSDGQIADIAAYIGTVVSGGGGGGGAVTNYQGLWWASSGNEAYWGVNFAHQGDQVFGTWYTYDTTGRPWWLSMLTTRTAAGSDVYSGPIYVDTGPPFDNFVGAGKPTQIGTATLTFADANNGTFAYSLNTAAAAKAGMAIEAAVAQQKSITRFDLGTGPQPTCTYATTAPDYASATNYQDLWWVPGAAEDGWGINFAHQGDSIFATWYTYDVDRAPLWLSVLATRVGATNVYTGTLYRTSGPRFDAYDAAKAMLTQVGTATLTFNNGGSATFSYATTGVGGLPAATQTKAIVRYVFAAPAGTVCK
jgi:cytochrome c553